MWLGDFGAATPVAPGACPTHPAHKPLPLAKVTRLQKALQGLATRTGDQNVSTKADGLVGRRTIDAINQALPYTDAPGSIRNLTRAQVLALAPQLAAWVEKAPVHHVVSPGDGSILKPTFASLPIQSTRSTGGRPMPAPAYYAPPQRGFPMQPPGYYPPPGYAARGPGGLPTDQASLDVRAFIPAQYEHLRIHPGMGLFVVAAGVIVVLMLQRDKKRGKD